MWRWVYILGCAATAPLVHGLTLASIATSIRAAVEPATLDDHASRATPVWVQTSSDVRTGVCTFYDAEKGFGFIRQEGALHSEQLFVHHTDLGCSKMCCSRGGKHVRQPALATGQRLSFTVSRHTSNGRTKATDVCKIERSGGAAAFDDDEEVDAMFDEFFSVDVPIHERDYDLFDI
jgi:cold shock CspA family protein|tara:strand:- start:63 stop:593 length:531 start_codon:yes stop_codon:yes gene_type:complete